MDEEEGAGGASTVPTADSWTPWQACSEGQWQEVPPGLYNLSLLQAGGGEASAADAASTGHGAACGEGVSALPGSAAQQEERQGGAWRHACELGGESWQLAHHPWPAWGNGHAAGEGGKGLAQVLASFSRPPAMLSPEGVDPDAAPAPGTVPRSNAAALQHAQRQATQQLQQADAAGCLLQGPSVPRAPPQHAGDVVAPYGVRRDVVLRVLSALRQAVQVRCSAIETRPPAAAGHVISGMSTDVETPAASSVSAAPPLAAAAPVLLLFSGGVDSTLLAALAHQCLPPGVPIELSNVCFDGGRSPDRQVRSLGTACGLTCCSSPAPKTQTSG